MAEKLIIVDDDTRLSAMLSDYLAGNGYAVQRAETARPAGRDPAAASRTPSSSTSCFRTSTASKPAAAFRTFPTVPVLMLTAKGEETDRIVGLELGADDYLPKPFNPRELLARLKAILRRRGGVAGAASSSIASAGWRSTRARAPYGSTEPSGR